MEQPSKFQHQLQPDMPSSSTMSTSPHPEQTPPWGALWVLALGLAMIVLDSSIVNVSIPTIIDDIGIDLTDAQWVTSLYNIVLAGAAASLRQAWRRQRTQTGIPNWNCDFRGKFIARRHIAGRWHAAHRSRVAGHRWRE